MTASNKIIIIIGALVLVIAAVTLLTPGQKPAAQIALSCTGVSTASNSSSISIVISNPSPATIVYVVGNLELTTNGSAGKFYFPMGVPMKPLLARQSSPYVVTTTSTKGEARIPVLWGFMYSARPSRWQQLKEDALAFLRMHDFRGRGAIYTNYVEGIKLE